MKNLKKLTREDLRNLKGGRACSVATQASNGTWTTTTGSCGVIYLPGSAGDWPVAMGYCNTGSGYHPVTSNGGVSHCND